MKDQDLKRIALDNGHDPKCEGTPRYYDGCLGYEAIRCDACGYELDLNAEANARATAEREAWRAPAVTPVTEIYRNPIEDANHSHFSHYEIQTVRLYQDAGGEQYFEPYTDPATFDDDFACGDVLYGVYGRYNSGGVEHLFDRATLDMAQDTLQSMIGTLAQ